MQGMRHVVATVSSLTLALLAGCTSPTPTPASSTEAGGDVWQAYIAAAGGDALLAIRGLRAVGVSVDPQLGDNRRLTIEAQAPSHYRQREAPSDTATRPVRTLVGFNGAVGWWAGNTVLGGDAQSDDANVRQRAYTAAGRQNFINTMAGMLPIWLRDAGLTLTPLGAMADGPDRGALAIALSVDGAPAGRLVFDPDTHLPRRLSVPYQRHIRPDGGEYSLEYADYRDAGNGARLPYRIARTTTSQSTGRTTTVQWIFSAYTLNPEFPTSTFKPPTR